VDRGRIVAEAEYFGLDNMLAQLRLQGDEEEKRKKEAEAKQPSKRVILYSVRHLRVVECVTVRPEESFCSKVSESLHKPTVPCQGSLLQSCR
jgi:hypothetical protein